METNPILPKRTLTILRDCPFTLIHNPQLLWFSQMDSGGNFLELSTQTVHIEQWKKKITAEIYFRVEKREAPVESSFHQFLSNSCQGERWMGWGDHSCSRSYPVLLHKCKNYFTVECYLYLTWKNTTIFQPIFTWKRWVSPMSSFLIINLCRNWKKEKVYQQLASKRLGLVWPVDLVHTPKGCLPWPPPPAHTPE